MAAVILCLSLGVGLGIGALLPEEATRWEAVKLAAAVGLCFAMMLLTYEHHFGDGGAGADSESKKADAQRSTLMEAGTQTDAVAGLVPLGELLTKPQQRRQKRKPGTAGRSSEDKAGADEFFVD